MWNIEVYEIFYTAVEYSAALLESAVDKQRNIQKHSQHFFLSIATLSICDFYFMFCIIRHFLRNNTVLLLIAVEHTLLLFENAKENNRTHVE